MPFRPTQADLDRYEAHFQEVMARWRKESDLENAYPVNPDMSKPTTPYTPPKSYRYPPGYKPVNPTLWTGGKVTTIDPVTGEYLGTWEIGPLETESGENIGQRVGDAIRI